LLLQACLGISVESRKKQLIFNRPYLPEGIPQLWIRDLRIGDCRTSLFLERTSGDVRVETLEKQGDIEVAVT